LFLKKALIHILFKNFSQKSDPKDIVGCGLVLNPANALSIFFTKNGILMGQSPLWLIILMI
jgi:hypothetical protein